MTGDNTLLLVITSRVSSKLKNFGRKVLENSSKVDCVDCQFNTMICQTILHTRCTSTDTLSVIALLEETVDTTNGELETRLGGARLRLGGGITGGLARLGLAAALARHVV